MEDTCRCACIKDGKVMNVIVMPKAMPEDLCAAIKLGGQYDEIIPYCHLDREEQACIGGEYKGGKFYRPKKEEK